MKRHRTTLGIALICLPLITNAANAVSTKEQLVKQHTHIVERIMKLTLELTELKLQREQLNQQLLLSFPGDGYSWQKPSKDKSAPQRTINANINDTKHSLTICRASYPMADKGVHPGQLVDGQCVITYAGKAYKHSDYELLISNNKGSWQPSTRYFKYHKPYQDQSIRYLRFAPKPGLSPAGVPKPTDAKPIVGGYEKGHPLYICRTIYDNTMHVGKVVERNCNIAYHQREVFTGDYEVLFE